MIVFMSLGQEAADYLEKLAGTFTDLLAGF